MSDKIIPFPSMSNTTTTANSMSNTTTTANTIPFPATAIKPKPKRKAITIARIAAMCERDEYEGICIACGEDAEGVEPDARKYECESCGEKKVYGCQELLFMVG